MPHHPTTTTLEDVKQRFQQWRKHRPHGQKIPRDLMLLAVALLNHHKKYVVCKELGLSYKRLSALEQPSPLAASSVPPTPSPESVPHVAPNLAFVAYPMPTLPICQAELQRHHDVTTLRLPLMHEQHLLCLLKAFMG